MESQKVVAVVDLARYSDIARDIEQHLGTRAIVSLNEQILEIIYSALHRVDVERRRIPFKYTGDGAIVIFETAAEASIFAEQVHKIACDHNRGKEVELAHRHFRVGISMGPVEIARVAKQGKNSDIDMAGLAIANAVRLEAACRTGEILASSDVWVNLPPDIRVLYGNEEEVKGKRGERFRVHRRAVVPSASWETRTNQAPSENGVHERNEKHLRDMLQMHERVAQHLEKQVELMGLYCPPHIQIQLEDVRRAIDDARNKLGLS